MSNLTFSDAIRLAKNCLNSDELHTMEYERGVNTVVDALTLLRNEADLKEDVKKEFSQKEAHISMSTPIPKWISPQEQHCRIGNKTWNVVRLWELSKDLPVFEIPLLHLNVDYFYEKLTLREIVMHMSVAIIELEGHKRNYPIILDENGTVMDGRHRILHALWHSYPTIKAVRFPQNPEPDRED